MSNSKQSVIVSRHYRPAPDDCARALELLLKKRVSEEGSPVLTALDDTRGDSDKYGSRATQKSTR